MRDAVGYYLALQVCCQMISEQQASSQLSKAFECELLRKITLATKIPGYINTRYANSFQENVFWIPTLNENSKCKSELIYSVSVYVKFILKTFTQIFKRYECTLNENTYFFCPSETAIAISHFAIVAHFNSSYNTRIDGVVFAVSPN